MGTGALTRAPGAPRGPSTPCKRETRSAVRHGGKGGGPGCSPTSPSTPGPPALLQNISCLAVPPPPALETRHLPSLQAGRGSQHHLGRPSHHPRQGPQRPPAGRGTAVRGYCPAAGANACAEPVPEPMLSIFAYAAWFKGGIIAKGLEIEVQAEKRGCWAQCSFQVAR